MSTKNLAKLTRLFILQEAGRLEDALYTWRCLCTNRYAASEHITRAAAVHAGKETRLEQLRRHEAVAGECIRRLEAALPTVVSSAPSNAIHAEVV